MLAFGLICTAARRSICGPAEPGCPALASAAAHRAPIARPRRKSQLAIAASSRQPAGRRVAIRSSRGAGRGLEGSEALRVQSAGVSEAKRLPPAGRVWATLRGGVGAAQAVLGQVRQDQPALAAWRQVRRQTPQEAPQHGAVLVVHRALQRRAGRAGSQGGLHTSSQRRGCGAKRSTDCSTTAPVGWICLRRARLSWAAQARARGSMSVATPHGRDAPARPPARRCRCRCRRPCCRHAPPWAAGLGPPTPGIHPAPAKTRRSAGGCGCAAVRPARRSARPSCATRVRAHQTPSSSRSDLLAWMPAAAHRQTWPSIRRRRLRPRATRQSRPERQGAPGSGRCNSMSNAPSTWALCAWAMRCRWNAPPGSWMGSGLPGRR